MFLGHVCDKTFGLGVYENHTLGLDVYGLLQLLCLPRQLRGTNPYAAKLIHLTNKDRIKTVDLSQDLVRKDENDFDWAKLAGANLGLELQWMPHQNSDWFTEYVKNVINFALGFVPGVGFLLQIAFSLGWAGLTDPDTFYETLKSQIPAALLTDGIISELKNDADAIKKHLPPGWDQVGKAMQIQPDLIKDDIGTDEKGSLDGVGKDPVIAKTGRIMGKSAGVPTPAATE